MKEAISAGDPITDIPLALQVDYFRVSSLSYFVPVSVKIPGSVIALAAKGGASVTQFDFAGQIQDEQRNVVGNVRDNIKINLDKDPAAKSNRKEFSIQRGIHARTRQISHEISGAREYHRQDGDFRNAFHRPRFERRNVGAKIEHDRLEQPERAV